MAEGGFRLPGASYDDLVKIIVAYGTRDEASNPGDVRKLDAVHRSSASRTNGFLVDIGVLRGEREKLVTRRGRELGLALFGRDEEEIKDVWRRIVATSEFFQNVVSAVKMQEGVVYESVQAYIAHAAGQPRNKPVMIGSSTVVEILKAANFLREEEGGRIFVLHDQLPQKILLEAATDELEDHADLADEPSEKAGGMPDGASEPAVSDLFAVEEGEPEDAVEAVRPEKVETVVNVHIHVNCSPDDLKDLAPKIRAMISSIKSGAPTNPEDELSLHFGEDDFPGRGFSRRDFPR